MTLRHMIIRSLFAVSIIELAKLPEHVFIDQLDHEIPSPIVFMDDLVLFEEILQPQIPFRIRGIDNQFGRAILISDFAAILMGELPLFHHISTPSGRSER